MVVEKVVVLVIPEERTVLVDIEIWAVVIVVIDRYHRGEGALDEDNILKVDHLDVFNAWDNSRYIMQRQAD